ncbi:MAG: pyridoxal phosphate-dependent aminotransferase, partial [Clostridiales bacterium]|nr:pyridoxal phosphate-dependent aminotransferase [Clostridiales bacterium]
MHIAKRAAEISPSLTLEITAKAKKFKEEGRDVVSFGAGEPDFNTPLYIRDAAKEALDKGLTKYTPASGTLALKKAVVDKLMRDNGLSYKTCEIVISNGAKHCLYNVLQAIVDPGDEVIIPAPYWLTYPELVKLCGGVSVFVETRVENGFKLTAAQLQAAITPKTRALILNNPNNPTGAVYTKDELMSLAHVIGKTELVVISDEVYEILNYKTGIYSIAAYSQKLKEQTVVVNGVSKTYAMTGWRIGFIAAAEPIAKAVAGMQSHTTSNPNSIAQYASVAAYENPAGQAFLAELKASLDRRRRLIMRELDSVEGLSYIKPEGAFYIMVDVHKCFGKSARGKKIDSAHAFATALLEQGDVAAIPCESFGAGDYIRLSYALGDE